MQISFGQFIPVRVRYSAAERSGAKNFVQNSYRILSIDEAKKIEEISAVAAKNISNPRKKGENDNLEQQRRIFKANVDDYELSQNPKDGISSSEILPLTVGLRQYFVTGMRDVEFIKNNDIRSRFLPEVFEEELRDYIEKNRALSSKTIDIYASDKPEKSENREKYNIDMIDFCSTINYKPISGDIERCR